MIPCLAYIICIILQAISQAYLNEPPRPEPIESGQQPSVVNQRCYPEAVDSVKKVQA